MKLRAIALIALMSVLTFAANAQATRADLPAPDNFLGIAKFEQSCCGFQKTIRSFGSFGASFPPSLEAFFEFE